LAEVQSIFIEKGVQAEIIHLDHRARLIIGADEPLAFVYGMRIQAFTMTASAGTVESVENTEKEDQTFYRVEVFLEHGGQQYDVMGYTQEQITADIVSQYERYLQYLHLSNSAPVGNEQ
jgi:choline/glycine/proline betaine transport protein